MTNRTSQKPLWGEDCDSNGLPLLSKEAFAALRVEALQGFDTGEFGEKWADLRAELFRSAELERQGMRDPRLPKGATSSGEALRSIIKFLRQLPSARNDLEPLVRLYEAICGLSEGKVSPILKPASKKRCNPGFGVPGIVIGIATRALNESINAGSKANEAASAIAKGLRARGHSKVTAATIENWRYGCMAGRGGRVPDAAIDVYQAKFFDALPFVGGERDLTEAIKRAVDFSTATDDLRAITKTVDGRTYITYVGNPNAWMNQFAGPKFKLRNGRFVSAVVTQGSHRITSFRTARSE